VGNFNTNIINLSKKILKLTKVRNVSISHETNTIDKRSYEVSTKSSKKINNNINFSKFTDNSIIETFKNIKKDKKPFLKKKVTLNVYKDYLKK
jgi:glycyl-tRNA synthetase alpha subunit